MVKNAGSTKNFIINFAKRAGKSIPLHSPLVPSFADSTARCTHYEEEEECHRLSLPKQPRKVKVHNLSTENGCYFADGFLVSNCDALRYFLYSYTIPTKQRKRIIGYSGGDSVTGYGSTPIFG
jgi:hypothetical protein